jgi:hypothetical protein
VQSAEIVNLAPVLEQRVVGCEVYSRPVPASKGAPPPALVLGLVARVSAFESQVGVAGHEHYAAILETLNAPATLARPATPRWQEIVDTVLTPLLQRAVEPGADNAALLSAAQTALWAVALSLLSGCRFDDG